MTLGLVFALGCRLASGFGPAAFDAGAPWEVASLTDLSIFLQDGLSSQ